MSKFYKKTNKVGFSIALVTCTWLMSTHALATPFDHFDTHLKSAPNKPLSQENFEKRFATSTVRLPASIFKNRGDLRVGQLNPAQEKKTVLNRSKKKANKSQRDSVFGSVAIPFSKNSFKAHWDRVRSASFNKERLGCEATVTTCSNQQKRLGNFFNNAEDLSFVEKLTAVNVLVNNLVTYSADGDSYSQVDYWATPRETLSRRVGDCEDFASLKMALLRSIGVPARSMSMVILKDRERDLYHAVLSVSTNKGHFILDNMSDSVVLDTQLAHYQPLFSFSENRSWIHGVRAAGKGTEVAALGVSQGSIVPGAGVAGQL